MTFLQVYQQIINRKLLNTKEHFHAYFKSQIGANTTKNKALWLKIMVNFLAELFN